MQHEVGVLCTLVLFLLAGMFRRTVILGFFFTVSCLSGDTMLICREHKLEQATIIMPSACTADTATESTSHRNHHCICCMSQKQRNRQISSALSLEDLVSVHVSKCSNEHGSTPAQQSRFQVVDLTWDSLQPVQGYLLGAQEPFYHLGTAAGRIEVLA